MDIFGAAGVVAVIIPVIVNFLKKLPFIGTKYAPIAAFLTGAVIGIIAQLVGFAGELTLIQSIIAGIGVGGVSTGLYDLQKQLRETAK